MSKYLSRRVKKLPQTGITSDRYEFIGLDQAEPDLGDPTVGVSSIGKNPYSIELGEPYVLISDGTGRGKRYWTPRANIISGGILQPGAISVYQNGSLAPNTSELSVFKLNFTGAGVTVVGVGSDRADIDITVTDISLFSGQTGSLAYKDDNGLIQGSNILIFNPQTNTVGIGSTIPKQNLDILGNVAISSNLSVGSSITTKSIISDSLKIDRFIIEDNTIVFQVTDTGVGIGSTTPVSILDIIGDVNISGYTTVGNLRSRGEILSKTLGVASTASVGSLNIGGTQVISSTRQLQNITSLDSITTATIETAIANAPNTFTDLNVTGITSLTTLGVSDVTTTRDFQSTGIATISRLNVISNLNSTGITTITDLQTVNLRSSGISTFNSIGISGLTTTRNLLVTGITTVNNFFVSSGSTVSIASSVGIGTTVAKYNLDVNGNVNVTGVIYLNSDPGTDGKVLLSKGSSSTPIWGDAAGVNVGSATSVLTIDRNGINTDYYLTFVNRTTGSLNQSISLDSNNLTYNPSTNTLSVDNINTKNIEVEGLSRVTTGIVTTTSTNEIVIDTLNNTLFRSARYNIQIETLGQLNLGSSLSVSGLSSGRNYYPGTYSNISLINTIGVGTDSRATITVSPEATLPIVGSLNGTFTTSKSLSGINSSQSVIFTQSILPSDYENSRLSDITLTSSGSGYIDIPTFTFSSPIIQGNPVEAVGVGSTATGSVNTMRVSNIVFNSVGFLTTIVPTVTISPSSGTTATASVGFAVSTIAVTNSGIGYLNIPSVQFSNNDASAGVSSIFVNKIRVTDPGFGYTTGDLNTIFVFNSGSASATNNSFSLPNSHTGFTIINPGFGYTSPPVLTVDSPQIGINSGIVTCTLGISTAIIIGRGSGYTQSPSFTISPNITNFSGYIGMGISSLGLQLFGGGGYDSNPDVSFIPVGGIGTGAQATSQIDISGRVESITITNPGFGYTVPPAVVFTGGTPEVSAAATIRTLTVENFVISNIGYGESEVPEINIGGNDVEFLDNPFTKTGTVGIATTSRVDNIILSTQGTLSIASTTIISGISTSNTIIREKNGNVDTINDTTITGIDTSNVSVGFAVTGTFVQSGTLVASVSGNSGGTIGLTTNLTNPTVGFGLTFFISDTLSSSVIVGQGVSGTNVDQSSTGTTVISIGNSSVTLSRSTLNSGIQTSTFNFGTLVIIPGVFQTNTITGISTSNISVGQRITGNIIPPTTNVSSIGNSSITINTNTTNTSVATTTFVLFDVFTAVGTGATAIASMGIGRITVGINTNNPLNLGFGTGYTALPGIAVTASDGSTGGGGIVTTSSFGIDTDCIRVTNSGIYTSIPSVLINSPKNGGGSPATANVGIGISTINVINQGSYLGIKPTISFIGGSELVSAAATVNNIVLNSVSVVTSGSGYTSGNIPATASFSNVSLAATVGLDVETITLVSPGLGYTITPSITFIPPQLPGTTATATAILANFDSSFSLLPGPGYGNTFIYYIEPVTSNTFRLFRDINRTNQITLGFSTVGTPNALVGGRVSNVSINQSGSGYQNGNILTVSAVSLGNTFSANVGAGFSFTVANTIKNYQISDLMLLQSVGSAATTTDIVEYGSISNLESLVDFSSDISGSNSRLKVRPKYRDNTIKISRTSISI